VAIDDTTGSLTLLTSSLRHRFDQTRDLKNLRAEVRTRRPEVKVGRPSLAPVLVGDRPAGHLSSHRGHGVLWRERIGWLIYEYA
jgi:hypothetical protein